MTMLRSGQISRVDALDTETVTRVAGRGANEVLSWAAAFGAMSIGGRYEVDQEFYEAVPSWIAGMAMIAARQVETR